MLVVVQRLLCITGLIFLLPWYLESYVDLNREQKQDLKELLIPFFKWHREEELPSYVAIIEDLELTLDSSVEFESIAEITNDVEESWFRLEDRMLLWAIPMTRDLSEKQIDGFIQTMETKKIGRASCRERV